MASGIRPFVSALSIFACSGSVLFGATQQPNIIFFLVDDMGWQDCSVPFYGNEKSSLNRRYKTPNMERLAAMGVRFENAYACPVSSPSRISWITGVNAARHRVTNWTHNWKSDVATDEENSYFVFPDWNFNGLLPYGAQTKISRVFSAVPLPEILQKRGYRTIHVGKAHFGTPNSPASDPRNLGFDVAVAGSSIGGPATYLVTGTPLPDGGYNYGGQAPNCVKGLSAYNKDGCYLTEALTRAALAEIDRAAATGKPFFLYLSHYGVHAPYDANRALDKRFENAFPQLTGQAKNYATMIASVDKSLGDILDRIEKDSALAKNTVVFFMSDNGGHCSNGNAPARGGKGSCFEGGIHEPMMVSWPGMAAPGTRCRTPVIIEDFFPSILEIAGVKNPKVPQGIDGKSFVRALRGEKMPDNRALVFHYPNDWGERSAHIGAPQSAIRVGDWKLIHFYENGETMLFDLKTDIGEQNNLASKNPKKVKELAKMLSDYLRRQKATLPRLKTTGAYCPLPDGSRL